MKKVLLIALLFLSLPIMAQNVQLHYDFGRSLYNDLDKTAESNGRAVLTTTVEMFRPDKFGSTFFFVDMDYNKGVSGAYWEISRELNFWLQSKMNWLSVHVEYNGGLNNVVGSYDDAFLAGLTYSGHSKDYSKTWSLSVMYKHIADAVDMKSEDAEANFQITGVWGISIADGWGSFSGFVDFWRECRPWQNTTHIFLAEPQLWLNLNKISGWEDVKLSVGAEVELSNNFVAKGFYAIPTLAVKWTF
ncbi:MAG: DUF5020 family protein [Alistipes sp.]|nr:DUF5020 family protein [Alistipes sp.]